MSPIIEHPDVARTLLTMKALVGAARAIAYSCGHALDQTAQATSEDDARFWRERANLLTPLAKSFPTDVGVDVASMGIQIHGGMGYVEETGAARFFRDARITPIYEGTNGIQAADLVGRKLSLSNGAAFADLIADLKSAAHPRLVALVDACESVGRRLQTADADDRLAASYPFLTMLSTATCGWLMERLAGEGDDTRKAVAAFYLDQIVPEALGLEAAASAPASQLYALGVDDF